MTKAMLSTFKLFQTSNNFVVFQNKSLQSKDNDLSEAKSKCRDLSEKQRFCPNIGNCIQLALQP